MLSDIFCHVWVLAGLVNRDLHNSGRAEMEKMNLFSILLCSKIPLELWPWIHWPPQHMYTRSVWFWHWHIIILLQRRMHAYVYIHYIYKEARNKLLLSYFFAPLSVEDGQLQVPWRLTSTLIVGRLVIHRRAVVRYLKEFQVSSQVLQDF